MKLNIVSGNEKRAEIRLEGLREMPVRLRASFQAQCAVEGRLKLGMLKLLGRITDRDARFSEMAAVFEEFSEAGGTPLTALEVETLVCDNFNDAWRLYIECLVTIFGKVKENAPAPKVEPSPAA